MGGPDSAMHNEDDSGMMVVEAVHVEERMQQDFAAAAAKAPEGENTPGRPQYKPLPASEMNVSVCVCLCLCVDREKSGRGLR